jgi:hypothetical protein
MDVEEHQLGLSMTSTRCLVNYTKLNRSDFVSHIHIYFTTWTHHIKSVKKGHGQRSPTMAHVSIDGCPDEKSWWFFHFAKCSIARGFHIIPIGSMVLLEKW